MKFSVQHTCLKWTTGYGKVLFYFINPEPKLREEKSRFFLQWVFTFFYFILAFCDLNSLLVWPVSCFINVILKNWSTRHSQLILLAFTLSLLMHTCNSTAHLCIYKISKHAFLTCLGLMYLSLFLGLCISVMRINTNLF